MDGSRPLGSRRMFLCWVLRSLTGIAPSRKEGCTVGCGPEHIHASHGNKGVCATCKSACGMQTVELVGNRPTKAVHAVALGSNEGVGDRDGEADGVKEVVGEGEKDVEAVPEDDDKEEGDGEFDGVGKGASDGDGVVDAISEDVANGVSDAVKDGGGGSEGDGKMYHSGISRQRAAWWHV